ncbi:LuxR C-terminal-related transcriptional regulator [Vibrio metoecus]
MKSDGCSNRKIAGELNISASTVSKYISLKIGILNE